MVLTECVCGKSTCRECRNRKAAKRYRELKLAGIDPNKPKKDRGSQYPNLDSDALICNHCQLAIVSVKALLVHKQEHSLSGFRKPLEEYSLLPSSQTWNG